MCKAYCLNAEPTNNVAPRVFGIKMSGSRLEDVMIRSTAALKCDVSAYPIPLFRYFKSSSLLSNSIIYYITLCSNHHVM